MRTRRRRGSAADPEWLSERAREVGGLFGDALRIMGRRALRAQLELLEGVVEVT